MCYLWRKSNVKALSTIDAKKLLSQVSEAGVEWFVFGGGDPLIRTDLIELIYYAKKIGLKIDLQTNALLLSDKILRQLQGYIDKIGFSLDGEQYVHDLIRDCQGNFQAVISAIESCQRLNIPTVIRTTISKQNIGNIAQLCTVISTYSVIKKWSLREFVPLARGMQNIHEFLISRDVFLNEIQRVMATSTLVKLPIQIQSITSEEMNDCYFLISPDGDVYSHPSNGRYQAFGKFPQESITEIIPKVKFNIYSRKRRDSKEKNNKILIPT